MVKEWDESQLVADGFEHVLVELEWFDGPHSGLVNVGRRPHYFQRRGWDADVEECFVWLADEHLVAFELEAWMIFVEWNQRYEAGTAGIDSHPAHKGINARYDDLTSLVAPHRQVPSDAKLFVAEWRFDTGERYRPDGVDYWVRWHT